MNDVIVIGAGAAGLAAARELLRAGRQPVVLEARDRIGGRIFTVHDLRTPVPAELGAEFVHGTHPALWDLLREAVLPAVEIDGDHLTRNEQGLVEAGGFDEMDSIFEAMLHAPEQSFAAFIDSADASAHVKHAATSYVEGFNAARRELVSVKWLNTENTAADDIEGDRVFRLLNGYDQVPHYLARGLDVRLSTPVRRVRWKRGQVVAESDAGEFRAAHAIVTAPFAVLASGGLGIDPEPAVLTNARTALATGNAIRVTFRFPKAVWDTHRRLSFLHGDQPFPVWWTSYPVRTPVITGWAAGPKADALAGCDKAQIIRSALASLRGLLQQDPGEPEASFFHDWQQDPWALGAYSYGMVNGAEAGNAFAEPVEDTLWFAGEAVCPGGHMGTVHGAIASGSTAARRLSGGR